MSKSKSPPSPPAEVRFVSSLPVEEAVKVLSALADEDMPVTLTEVNSDTWRFAIGYYRPGQKTASVTVAGTLRRWQGTYTRLNFTSYLNPIPAQPGIPGLAKAFPVIALMLLTVLFAVNAMGRITDRTMTIGLMSLALATGVFLLSQYRQRSQADSQALPAEGKQRHIRDMLFHDIVRVFKLAGDVSQNEDNLDASDDPGMDAIEDNDPFGQYSVIRQRK